MAHDSTPTHSHAHRGRGVTLIETCVVVAIVAILAAAASPALQSLLDARRLDGAATQLATDIQLARSEAVARNLPLRLTLLTYSEGSCYLIHTGDAGDCHCATSGPSPCSHGALAIKTTVLRTADRLSLVSRTASVLFDPLHGTCTPAATLRVIGTPGREIDQVVNVMGRVRSCSPNAAVPGYRAC